VKALGMETCMTLGMLADGQAERLAEAGLDFYNHNLDTSPEYYAKIITTRTWQDRIDTLARVRGAGYSDLLRRHYRHGRGSKRPHRASDRAGHV
jgi:biotin synthase